jgi:hypothetical protein
MYRKIGLWVGLIGLMTLLVGGAVWSEEKKPEPANPETKPEEKAKDKSDLKAKEMLLQAFKKMDETKGFHLETRMSQKTNESTIKFSTKGIHQNPNLTYLKMKVAGLETALYQKDGRTAVKNPLSGEWEDSTHGPDEPASPLEGLLGTIKGLENERFLSEEKVKDKDCKIVEASLYHKFLTEQLKIEMQEPGIDVSPDILNKGEIKIIKSSYKVWIAKDDLLPYKITYSVAWEFSQIPEEKSEESAEPLKMTFERILEMKFFDYNKDIEIKLPPEVKEILDKEEGKK